MKLLKNSVIGYNGMMGESMAEKKLKIAMVGAIWESTPPKLYGGTERVVSLLTEELVRQGQDVTLFASGDSKTRAKLIATVPKALYRMNVSWSNLAYPLEHIYQSFKSAKDFDIYHVHLGMGAEVSAAILVDLLKIPAVFTFHSNLPTKNTSSSWYNFFSKLPNLNYVSISNSQRTINPLNWVTTIYHGIDLRKYTFNPNGGDYLAWLGRFSPEKGPAEAIKVALALKKKLVMAGKTDWEDEKTMEFYHHEIEPQFKKEKKLLRYIGEIDDAGKNRLLCPAKCLVSPINWREPFGLVVAEANACGTPVVAFANGSMPEIIKNEVNGYLIKPGDVRALICKIREIYEMPIEKYQELRQTSRLYAEKNFSVERMTNQYLDLYQKIANKN